MNNNKPLADEITEFHRLRQIKDALDIEFDIESIISTYNKLHEKYNGFPKSPFVMIKTDVIFDFYKNRKTEFEKVLFAVYAGIRSIIGRKKKFCQTTHNMIFMRMVGAKNNEILPEILKDKNVKMIYEKYAEKRYQRDKVLNELVKRKFLSSKIGTGRRTYLSCSLNFEELSDEIIRSFEESDIKNKEKSARSKISHYRKQHLNKGSTINDTQ